MKNRKLLLLVLFSCLGILCSCILSINEKRSIGIAKENKYSKDDILKARSVKNEIAQEEVESDAERVNGINIDKKYILPVKTQAQQK